MTVTPTDPPTAQDRTLKRAEAEQAIDRWERRAVAYARAGQFREADDANEEARDLRRTYGVN
jgi:hypothetical protein